jgi:type IV secretory pathway VirJ component
MTRYLGAWSKRRVWLVGFSFGADVLPTLVDKLSPANRARITQMVLLSPSRDGTFEIELQGYMITQGGVKEHLKTVLQRVNPIRHYDPLPRLQALHGQPPVVCYYGLEDAADSICDEPGLPGWVTVHAKRGGQQAINEELQTVLQMLVEDFRDEILEHDCGDLRVCASRDARGKAPSSRGSVPHRKARYYRLGHR